MSDSLIWCNIRSCSGLSAMWNLVKWFTLTCCCAFDLNACQVLPGCHVYFNSFLWLKLFFCLINTWIKMFKWNIWPISVTWPQISPSASWTSFYICSGCQHSCYNSLENFLINHYCLSSCNKFYIQNSLWWLLLFYILIWTMVSL